MEDLMQKVREAAARMRRACLTTARRLRNTQNVRGDARLLGFSHYYKGRTYYLSNETGKVFEEIGEALGYLEQSGQWELVAAAYNLMAIVSVGKGQSVVCDRVLSGRIKILQKYELIEVESRIESNLGSLYMECGQYSDARDYLEQAISRLQTRTGRGAQPGKPYRDLQQSGPVLYEKRQPGEGRGIYPQTGEQSAKRILRRWITFM